MIHHTSPVVQFGPNYSTHHGLVVGLDDLIGLSNLNDPVILYPHTPLPVTALVTDMLYKERT